MKTKKRFTMFISRIIVLCIFAIPVKAISATLYVATNGTSPNDGSSWEYAFTTIQAAINTASDGDIIIVGSSGTGHGSGEYTENINVTKSLTIKSENGYNATTVEAANANDHVFEVKASNVTIGGKNCGFSIYGTASGYCGIYIENYMGCIIQNNRCGWDYYHKNYYGIYLYYSSNNTITDNIFNTNNRGVYLLESNNNLLTCNTGNSNDYGDICLQKSNNNVLSGNFTNSSGYGIYLQDSNDNTLSVNSTNLNNEGIYLHSSSNNNLSDNTCQSNSDGIFVSNGSENNVLTNNNSSSNLGYGICLQELNKSTLRGNTANMNSHGIILFTANNNLLAGNITLSNKTVGIDLHSSNNNTLTKNTANSNNDGIFLRSSDNNTITDNTANFNNNDGIYLWGANNCVITGDTANSNSYYGIDLLSSNNNTIYLNNFSSNSTGNVKVSDKCSGNKWNTSTAIYYDYTGGSFYKNYLGNYYGDYTGSDPDGDGIGNLAYNGIGMYDNFPLIATSDHYSLQAWWLNTDSKMYRKDWSNISGNVVLSSGLSHIWCANQPALEDVTFSAIDNWNGQIAFNSVPSNSHTFKIEIGFSTNGSDFIEGGPVAIIAGNGIDSTFTYETNMAAFTVPKGNYLAYKITNNNSLDYKVQTGSIWSYCSSPDGSEEYLVSHVDNLVGENELNGFSLSQNQPNPFSANTTIRYELPERSSVTLKVYDLFGREVTTLLEGEQNAGKYEVEFNGTNLPSGIYFYQLQAGEFLAVRKLLLLK